MTVEEAKVMWLAASKVGDRVGMDMAHGYADAARGYLTDDTGINRLKVIVPDPKTNPYVTTTIKPGQQVTPTVTGAVNFDNNATVSGILGETLQNPISAIKGFNIDGAIGAAAAVGFLLVIVNLFKG